MRDRLRTRVSRQLRPALVAKGLVTYPFDLLPAWAHQTGSVAISASGVIYGPGGNIFWPLPRLQIQYILSRLWIRVFQIRYRLGIPILHYFPLCYTLLFELINPHWHEIQSFVQHWSNFSIDYGGYGISVLQPKELVSWSLLNCQALLYDF